MQRKQNSHGAYYISLVIITLFFGCSLQQTHKTLTFFFDGVDKVNFLNNYLSKDSLSKDAIAKRDALLKRNRPDLCVHKPYKEKKCDECHTPDKRLLMPMPGLCFRCHTNFNANNTVIHGPVASGSCTNCHNQHSSKYPKLLIRQGQQICLFCHSPALVFANKVHRDIEDADCILCHNPHGGTNRFMVRQNISRDANRIALMSELTYRHLYGQIFCKVPGDINRIIEIYIADSRGVTVSTAHPDINGNFILSNMHPDQNYIFRFKNDLPDCRINIMDCNGAILYTVEKNKKGKYAFEKTAYETIHTAINDAHFLGDTLTSLYPENRTGTVAKDQPVPKEQTGVNVIANTAKTPDTASNTVKPAALTPPGSARPPMTNDLSNSPGKTASDNKVRDTIVHLQAPREEVDGTTSKKENTVVTNLPATIKQELIEASKNAQENEKAIAYVDAVRQFINNDSAILFSRIYFDKAKANLTASSISALNEVVAYMEKNPESRVYLASNADERGTVGFNQLLSDNRARSVVQFLTSKGIKAKRIKAKGYGKTFSESAIKPGDEAEKEYQKNRRVDIYMLDK